MVESEQIGFVLLVIINLLVLIWNFYQLYQVEKAVKKLNKYNATGFACEMVQLGMLIPINFGLTLIDFIVIIFVII